MKTWLHHGQQWWCFLQSWRAALINDEFSIHSEKEQFEQKSNLQGIHGPAASSNCSANFCDCWFCFALSKRSAHQSRRSSDTRYINSCFFLGKQIESLNGASCPLTAINDLNPPGLSDQSSRPPSRCGLHVKESSTDRTEMSEKGHMFLSQEKNGSFLKSDRRTKRNGPRDRANPSKFRGPLFHWSE